MQSLLEIFERTFDDRKLDQDEKKVLSKILGERNLPSDEIGYIRNRLYDFARDELGTHSASEVITWLQKVNKILLRYHTADLKPKEVYFSPGDDCCQALISRIQAVKDALDICVFTISDDRITKAIKAAHRRGVKIRIITDDEKVFDKGSDIRKMSQAGINIRTDDCPHHMHHKFAILDKKILITGSYNWTRSASRYNYENFIVSWEPTLTERYFREFENLWGQMIPFEGN